MISSLLLLLLLLLEQTLSQDYCQPALCPKYKKHIACRHNSDLGKACGAGKIVLLNLTQHQPAILNMHNSPRNSLAAGKVAKLPPTERMASMQWHEELEALALLNAKQCVLTYDPCHNTAEFYNSGQNVALLNISADVLTNDELLLKDAIERWWDQHKAMTAEHLQRFPKPGKLADSMRNFAVMARDNNTHVGCAAIRFEKLQLQHFLFVCNYASNYVAGQPLYRPKSVNCQGGYDKQFKELCKPGENYRDV
ncbi:CG6628, partial [Drosophila busckii]